MIMNPLWKREINIAQVDFEMMLQELTLEWSNNGKKIYSEGDGRPVETEREVQVDPQQYPAV